MTIEYNGLWSPTNLVTFTNVPNILKVYELSQGGTKATITIILNQFTEGVTPTSDGQYYISMFGETITSVLSPQNAVNKSFYIGENNSTTAAYIVRALRNCPSVSANFSVMQSGTSIVLTAYDTGSKFADNVITSTNLPSATSEVDGESDSDYERSIINVNIYSGGEYVTTLEKNMYNGSVYFNLSPLLTTMASYQSIVPYNMTITALKTDGEYEELGSIGVNYASVGYMCNQGYKYLSLSSFDFAQNVSRGEDGQMKLYTYLPKIDFSFYTDSLSSKTFTIDYLDSAYNVITSQTSSIFVVNKLTDVTNIAINQSAFTQSFYIDLKCGTDKIRYNVIKPLKTVENVQRIYWRNSYGGISFFDFVGKKTETRELSVETYEKNLFDYYETNRNSLKQVYDNAVDYTVTLKSHLFEEDGKYIFNDLIQSAKVWTTVNSQVYEIILSSVSVEEVSNNAWEATIKYKYSQTPNLI